MTRNWLRNSFCPPAQARMNRKWNPTCPFSAIASNRPVRRATPRFRATLEQCLSSLRQRHTATGDGSFHIATWPGIRGAVDNSPRLTLVLRKGGLLCMI